MEFTVIKNKTEIDYYKFTYTWDSKENIGHDYIVTLLENVCVCVHLRVYN